jgi:hypothetical protein
MREEGLAVENQRLAGELSKATSQCESQMQEIKKLNDQLSQQTGEVEQSRRVI